ncbi:unnamed protein product [Ectocarpus sp. 13 AM-2016]
MFFCVNVSRSRRNHIYQDSERTPAYRAHSVSCPQRQTALKDFQQYFSQLSDISYPGLPLAAMDFVKDLLWVLGTIEAAIQGADAVRVTMRTRIKDYRSMLRVLQDSAPAVFEYELEMLQNLFTEIEDLHAKHTTGPEDGRFAKMAKMENGGSLALPYGYVERAAAQEVADALTNLEEPRTPYAVVGMGGRGKNVLVSAVPRMSSVREQIWMRVGTGAKDNLLPLLQGLAREMGGAPTDTPRGVPHVLDSLEQVK